MGDDIKDLKREIENKRNELNDSFFQEDAAAAKNVNTKIDKRRDLRGHFGKVYSIHWAGAGSESIVSASQDGKLIVWNANTTNKINAIPLRSSWVMTCAFEQEENQMVACGGLDNICSVYVLNSNDTGTGTRAYRELQGHDGYLSSCRFMGKGNIVTSSGDSTCRYWDIEKNACTCVFKEHVGDVMSVSPHPTNPNLFVSGSCDTVCKLWDIRGNGDKPVASVKGGEEKIVGSQVSFSGHESDINATAFFPDGNAFGTGSDDASCRIFDMRCYQEVNSFRHQRILCGITSVAFSSSGRVLFGGYDDFSCIGWDTLQNPNENGEASPVVTLSKHDNRVSCVGVQGRGQALATGSWDTLIRIWA